MRTRVRLFIRLTGLSLLSLSLLLAPLAFGDALARHVIGDDIPDTPLEAEELQRQSR